MMLKSSIFSNLLKISTFILIICLSTANAASNNEIRKENDGFQVIEKVLKSYDNLDQAAINELVSDIKAVYSTSYFVNALDHNLYEYRGGAALILGLLQHDESIPELLKMTANDPDAFCRAMAAIALYQIDEKASKKEALLNLLEEFKDPGTDIGTKCLLATALGDIGDKKAIPDVIEVLKDRDAEAVLQESVIRALGKIGDPGTVSDLIEFIFRQDIKAFVRDTAFRALGSIGNEEAVNFLSEVLNSQESELCNRIIAAEALSFSSSQKAVSALITAANDESVRIRFFAIDTLGQIANERATKAVVAAINDENEQVRFKATILSGYIGDEKAIPALKEIMDDDRVCFGEKISDRAKQSIKQIKERIGNLEPENQ